MNTPGQPVPQWRKSSHSGHQGGECVEIAGLSPVVTVRDSKDPEGPTLMVCATDWRAFTQQLKDGEHDFG